MALDFIKEMYIPIVLVICLCVGFIAKKWLPTDNKWIPTILAILGAILGCISFGGISLEAIGAGAVTGLASTGLHQLFKQLIEGGDTIIEIDLDNAELLEEERDDIEEEIQD